MIQVTCTACGLRIQVPPTVQGREGTCFGCGGKIQVPVESQPSTLNNVAFAAGDKVADRYVVERQIGSGGMGVVYKAQDELIDEEVALKFMNPYTLRTQKGQYLFIKEAQVARRLRHENIVAVHDVSTTPEGVLYLSMEYVNGVSLRDFLQKQRKNRKLIDVRLAIELILQILTALEYAHRTVMHRDLKPENVMLLSGERAKVLDFGLAVAIEDLPSVASESGKSKRVTGTMAYAAPEQRKHLGIDFRADLFAVGLMLHELLTLRTPLDESVTVMDVRQDVAPSITAILGKATREDRVDRWQSAGKFHEALKNAYGESYRPAEAGAVQTADGAEISTKGMVYFGGGCFLMGSNEVREEAPEFEASAAPFYMDKTPVTVEQYKAFLEATNHEEPKSWRDPELNGMRQPITGVTWDDAKAYAAWAGKRLPTERQWEFAARGRENRGYPWGSLAPESTRCNFGDYLGMPSIVNMHESGATPDGLLDMAGNVHEWTLDGYAPYEPANGGDGTQSSSPRRVARGGSWHSPPGELRSTARKGLFPETQLTTVGFRCVLPAPGEDGSQ
ncbi:MAG: bifunctional serine/threonine-protein kinase/formylglycine-generating enzyme family protein [Candidatus Hydrogenedentes bacterium]|nr:bifunctional serine/threonine-protein kinase/formylglycine-generating enzyme family protein [Candidatus Hydrogenedentota bacterium]